LNVAPDAASIAVTRLLARSEDAVIRPFVEQVSREPRLRDESSFSQNVARLDTA